MFHNETIQFNKACVLFDPILIVHWCIGILHAVFFEMVIRRKPANFPKVYRKLRAKFIIIGIYRGSYNLARFVLWYMNKHLSSRKRKSNLAPKQHCTLPLNRVFENVSVSKKSFIISALFVVWKPILFALKQKAFCTEVKKNNIYRRTWWHCLHHIFIRIWIGVIHRLTGFTYCCWSDSSEFQRNN